MKTKMENKGEEVKSLATFNPEPRRRGPKGKWLAHLELLKPGKGALQVTKGHYAAIWACAKKNKIKIASVSEDGHFLVYRPKEKEAAKPELTEKAAA